MSERAMTKLGAAPARLRRTLDVLRFQRCGRERMSEIHPEVRSEMGAFRRTFD